MPQGWIVLAALAIACGPALAREPDPLARYRGSARLVVIAAPDPVDPQLAAQRRIAAGAQAAFKERDLVVVEAVGSGREAVAIRRRLDLPDDAFRAVLVGKDGGAKLAAGTALPAAQLFEAIDAMPMRCEERARR